MTGKHWKVIGWTLVATAVIGLVGLLLWPDTLRAQYEKEVGRLRESGVPVEMKDLDHATIPESQNGAIQLAEAHRLYRRLTSIHAAPECFELSHELWDLEDWTKSTAFVNECAPVVRLIREGVVKPAYRLDVDWQQGADVEVPSVPLAQELSRLLEVRARIALRGERDKVAIDSLRLILGIAERQERYLRVPYLARLILYAIVAEVVEDMAVDTRLRIADVRAELDPLLRAVEDRARLVDSLVGIRALGIWLIKQRVQADKGTVGGFAHRDGLEFLSMMGELIALAPREYHAGSNALRHTGERLERLSPEFAVTLRLGPKAVDLWSKTAFFQAEVRLVRVGLALLQYHAMKSAWPQRLEQLAPGFIEELPLDPFTGRAFKYERSEGRVQISCDSREAARWANDVHDLTWLLANQ